MMALMLVAAAAGATPPPRVYRRLVPLTDTAGWFVPGDYPPAAIASKAEGITHFMVEVGVDGRATACRVTKSSGNPALDAATCRALLARAAFHPMVDRKGRPTTATFENVVRWRLPKQTTEEISDRTFDAHAVIAPTGEVVECTMSGSGSGRFTATASGNTCGPFGERAFLANLMGADYAKARDSHVRLQVSYEGLPQKGAGRTPDFYQLLAESEIAINADGTMGKCTSVKPLQMQGRAVDLCSIVAMAPPRFQRSASARRAIFVLDLAANYR